MPARVGIGGAGPVRIRGSATKGGRVPRMGGCRGVAGSLERRFGGPLINRYENALDDQKRKEQEFLALGERFRAATDPEEIGRLGDQMGRMVFGE